MTRPSRFLPGVPEPGSSSGSSETLALLDLLRRCLPVSLLVLDADLRIAFANEGGRRLAALWCHGPESLKCFKLRALVAVPEEVAQACQRLYVRTGRAARQERVCSARRPGLSAVVSFFPPPKRLEGAGCPGVGPAWFAVHLHESDRQEPAPALGLEAGLTASERRVTQLVAGGFDNKDVARQLGKSIATVKTQLQTIFRKLDVGSRAELILTWHGWGGPRRSSAKSPADLAHSSACARAQA